MNKLSNCFVLAKTVVLSLGLIACSGESLDFEEAVEANELALNSVQILPPAGRLANLFLNPGEQVSFSLEARNADNQIVELSSADRRWSVVGANPGAASIDEDGNLTARSNGSAVVQVQIGSIVQTFPFTVQQATLLAFTAIVGEDSLERCIPRNYTAIGEFSDNSSRAVTNSDWIIQDPVFGDFSIQDGGVVQVNALNSPSLVLVARVGNITLSESIPVLDTLQSISITPETLSLQDDDTLSLGATGTYLRNGVERNVSLTNSVLWEVPVSNGVVTISNEFPDIGVVTAEAEGNSEVSAVCGNTREQRAIVVIE